MVKCSLMGNSKISQSTWKHFIKMENGGKRKRVINLSLKSFKKPALNYVKQQSIEKCLEKGSSNKDKSNFSSEKSLLTTEEQIKTPISENR